MKKRSRNRLNPSRFRFYISVTRDNATFEYHTGDQRTAAKVMREAVQAMDTNIAAAIKAAAKRR